MLLALTGSVSATFNDAATEPHYGNFLLWESEVSGGFSYEEAHPTRENGMWIYDDASGVLAYVRQNPWSFFDPHGLDDKKPGLMFYLMPGMYSEVFGDPRIPSNATNGQYQAMRQNNRVVDQGFAKMQLRGAQTSAVISGGILGAQAAAIADPSMFAWGLTPAGGYTIAETATTGFELAVGYDGPPIIPGPGDFVRSAIQGGTRNGAKAMSGASARYISEGLTKSIKPGSLTNVQTRDLYNSVLAPTIDSALGQMKKDGATLENMAKTAHNLRNELKMSARGLMKDQKLAKSLPDPQSWNDVRKKYDGDYGKIINASKRTSKEYNDKVELLRKKQSN